MAKPQPALLEPARYPHTLEVGTRFADLDPNRHINNTAMAALFEDARARVTEEFVGNWIGSRAMMIASITIDYVGQAHYPRPVTFHSAVARVGETSITLQQLARQDGQPVAVASTVIVHTDGNRPVPIPAEWRPVLTRLELAA